MSNTVNNNSSFPFFIPTEVRPLSEAEHAVVERLLIEQSDQFKTQSQGLIVVGRCGCGCCPTIFFQPHEEGAEEKDLVSCIGRDRSGGLVGAVLTQKNGLLSQLEFYSVDGHDPWFIPEASTLEPNVQN